MRSNKCIFIFVAAALIGFASGQVPALGSCPENVKVVENFDGSKYLGKWYEHSKYPFIFEAGGRCIYAIYGKGENSSISVLNSQINKLTNKRTSINGTAALTDEPGKLLVKFNGVPSFVKGSNYWVLGTDYTNYSVVYSCSEVAGQAFHTTVVWILVRDRKTSTEIISKANQIIDDNKISKEYFLTTDQSGCPEDEHNYSN